MTKKIIATFRGTGYEIAAGKHEDRGFKQIENRIERHSSVEIHSYDGCQVGGGGLFAYGVELACDDLYNKLLALPEDENINLHLLAHSRGCISAYMLVAKINANPTLKNRVNIFLDLRDPVPGNLGVTASLDITHTNVAVQNKDLSAFDNVKEAHITIQEKGIMGVGFDVLIPIFSPTTKVAVDYIPGLHDIQQSRNVADLYSLDGIHEFDHLVCSDKLFNLGIYKSLQLLVEQGIALSSAMTHEQLVQRQVEIYNHYVNLYKNDPKLFQQLASHRRDLHFGGHFITNPSVSEANALNMRHAALMNVDQPKPLLTFKHSRIKANRFDIEQGIMIDKALTKLNALNHVALQTIFMEVMDEQGTKSSSSLFAKPTTLLVNMEQSALENLYRNITQAKTHDLKYAIASKVLGFNADNKSLQKYLVERLTATLAQQLPHVRLDQEKSSTSSTRFKLPSFSFNPSDIHNL